MRYQGALAHRVALGLGASSPVVARQAALLGEGDPQEGQSEAEPAVRSPT